MKYDAWEKQNNQNGMLVTVGDIVVRLVFAEEKNSEVPEVVGNILKGAYLQRQSV